MLAEAQSETLPRSFPGWYEPQVPFQELSNYLSACHSSVSAQLLLSSLFSHFLFITHTHTQSQMRHSIKLIQLCRSSSGSYNTHPLMVLEDAPGSMEFTVTGLQGKSHTFLGVSLDNV